MPNLVKIFHASSYDMSDYIVSTALRLKNRRQNDHSEFICKSCHAALCPPGRNHPRMPCYTVA